ACTCSYLGIPMSLRSFFFFFFQAEDGIRDFHVTGVQTCALPILVDTITARDGRFFQIRPKAAHSGKLTWSADERGDAILTLPRRSEERRVGKECRSRRLREE